MILKIFLILSLSIFGGISGFTNHNQPRNTIEFKNSNQRISFSNTVLQISLSNAPVFITIGPQCSGKTTYLENLSQASDFQIIAIDDHPAVYTAVTLQTFLKPEASTELLQTMNASRLMSTEANEARAVASFLLGKIDTPEIRSRLKENLSSEEMIEDYIGILKQVQESIVWKTEVVQLFNQQSVFPTGVKSSQAKLRAAAMKRPKARAVAWGNTNTKPKDYEYALHTASCSQRPVRFIRWGHELKKVDQAELWRRNVVRFAQTGRYIPAKLFATLLHKTEELLQRSQNGDPIELAQLAGYHMDSEGYVFKINSTGNATDFNKKRYNSQSPQAQINLQHQPRKNETIATMRPPFNFPATLFSTNLLYFMTCAVSQCHLLESFFKSTAKIIKKHSLSRSPSKSRVANFVLSKKLNYQTSHSLFHSDAEICCAACSCTRFVPFSNRKQQTEVLTILHEHWGKKREWRRSTWDYDGLSIEFHQYNQDVRTVFESVDAEDREKGIKSLKPKRNDSALTREWDTWQLVKQIRSGKSKIM